MYIFIPYIFKQFFEIYVMSYSSYFMNEQKMVVELNVILKVFTSFYKSTNLTRLSERELRQLRLLILLCSSSIVHWYFTFFFQYVHLDNERIIVQWEMTTFLWIEKRKKVKQEETRGRKAAKEDVDLNSCCDWPTGNSTLQPIQG